VLASTRQLFLDDNVLSACRKNTAGSDLIEVSADRVVVVGHSGSTGRPRPPQDLGSLVASADSIRGIARRTDRQRAAGRPWILATVPSQHMYGIKTAVLLPCSRHGPPRRACRCIRRHRLALAEVPPALLVTTPCTCGTAGVGHRLPPLAVVVSRRHVAPEVAQRRAALRAALVESSLYEPA